MLYSVNFNKNYKDSFVNSEECEQKVESLTQNIEKLKNIQSLTFEQLTDRMKEKKIVKVVSCYYGINQLNDFLKKLTGRNRSTDVILCATGVSKDNWEAQVNALLDKEKGVRLGQRQNVYLYTKFTLLHSKIYFSKSTRDPSAYKAICLLGSANLSQNAFGCNEEVLADIDDKETKKAVENYIDFILNDKDNLIDIRALQNQKRKEGDDFELDLTSYGFRQETTSVLDYLLSGYLAFKCSRSFSLGFSDGEWRKEINSAAADTEYIKNKKTLSMAAVLNVDGLDEIADDIEDDYDDELGEDDSISTIEKRSSRISIKSNSIETCFGYWIPQERIDKVRSLMKCQEKELNYNKILTVLRENKDRLKGDVRDRLIEAFNEVDLNVSRRSYFEEKIISHLKTKLRYYEKNKSLYLSSCYFITPMPNLFEDPASKMEFLESFWLDVQLRSHCKIAQNKSETKNIAKKIFGLFKGCDDEMMDLSNELNEVWD